MRALTLVAASMLLGGCLYGSCPEDLEAPPIETMSYLGTTDRIGSYAVDGEVAVYVDADAELVTVTFQSEGRTVQQRYRITAVREGYD